MPRQPRKPSGTGIFHVMMRGINHSASTFLNIAQMTQYRMKYLQDRDAEDKEKMYKHAFLAGAGIACLLTIGIAELIESCR